MTQSLRGKLYEQPASVRVWTLATLAVVTVISGAAPAFANCGGKVPDSICKQMEIVLGGESCPSSGDLEHLLICSSLSLIYHHFEHPFGHRLEQPAESYRPENEACLKIQIPGLASLCQDDAITLCNVIQTGFLQKNEMESGSLKKICLGTFTHQDDSHSTGWADQKRTSVRELAQRHRRQTLELKVRYRNYGRVFHSLLKEKDEERSETESIGPSSPTSSAPYEYEVPSKGTASALAPFPPLHLHRLSLPLIARPQLPPKPADLERARAQLKQALLKHAPHLIKREDVGQYISCLLGHLKNGSTEVGQCQPNLNVRLEPVTDKNEIEGKIVWFKKVSLGQGKYKGAHLAFLYDENDRPIQLLARLKILAPRKNSSVLGESQRFQKYERQNLDTISELHPAWKVYYSTRKGDRVYFQPYLGEGSLADLMDRKGTEPYLRFFEVLKVYGAPLLSDLKMLHDKNIYHFDIKPENIMRMGDELKLTDFTTAHTDQQIRRGSFQPPTTLGTASYMAPEIASASETPLSQKYSASADIWSVGMTLYNVATRGRESSCLDGSLRDLLNKVGSIKTYDDLCSRCHVFCQEARLPDGTYHLKSRIPSDPAEKIVYDMLNPSQAHRSTLEEALEKINKLPPENAEALSRP